MVVCSKHVNVLTPVVETLRALLFPFDWHVSYFSVLYGERGGYLDSPSPYLFGFYGKSPSGPFPPEVCVCVCAWLCVVRYLFLRCAKCV